MERSGLPRERLTFRGGGKRSSEDSVGETSGGEIRPVSRPPPGVSAVVVVVVVGAAERLITDGTGERRFDRAEIVCFSRSLPSSSISTKGS